MEHSLRHSLGHSLGHWNAVKMETSGMKPYWRVETDVQILCLVSDSKGQPAEANAYLMAAAKKLLKAAEHALICLQDHPDWHEGTKQELIKAIAKAKGELR